MKQSERAVVTKQLVRRGHHGACPGFFLFCSWNQVNLWGPARLTYASPPHRAWAWKPDASLFTSSYDSNYPVKFICAFAVQGVLSLPDTKLLSTAGGTLGQETASPVLCTGILFRHSPRLRNPDQMVEMSFQGTFSSHHRLSPQRVHGSFPALSVFKMLRVTIQIIPLLQCLQENLTFEKDKYHVISLVCGIWKIVPINRTETDSQTQKTYGYQRGSGRGINGSRRLTDALCHM